MKFRVGDRVKVRLEGDDGLPLVQYGFVGGVATPDGPALVLLDDELGSEVVPLCDIEPIEVTTLELCLPGTDLCGDNALRRGLVVMWQAEAEQAGLAVENVVPMGDGVLDDVGSWALAELWAGGERFVLRASMLANDPDMVHVRAVPHSHWDC
jgi:hypothetical protein